MISRFNACLFEADMYDTVVTVQVIECMKQLQIMLKQQDRTLDKWFAELYLNCPFEINSLSRKENEKYRYMTCVLFQKSPIELNMLLKLLYLKGYLNPWVTESKRFTFHLAICVRDCETHVLPFTASRDLLELFDNAVVLRNERSIASFYHDMAKEKFAFIKKNIVNEVHDMAE